MEHDGKWYPILGRKGYLDKDGKRWRRYIEGRGRVIGVDSRKHGRLIEYIDSLEKMIRILNCKVNRLEKGGE